MSAMTRERKLKWVPIEKIVPNQKNPRSKKHFEPEELSTLRQSISEHGILQPVLVQPFRDGAKEDRFELIEGERRYTVAKGLGMKEMPAVIGNKLDDHDQMVAMYNVHTQFRGWEVAEQLKTIKQLVERNGKRSDAEMAAELGMSVGTFRDRLRVLGMGDSVIADIATDKVNYASALRVAQVSSSLAKKRPKLVKSLGGEKAVEKKLLDKAKKGPKGISQELVESKKDLSDVDTVPDTAVRKYIEEPKVSLKEVRSAQASLAERREAEDLARALRRTQSEIAAFDVDLDAVPNLRELRAALAGLLAAASELEADVVDALLNEDE